MSKRKNTQRWVIKSQPKENISFYLIFVTPEIISHFVGVISSFPRNEVLLSTASLLRTSKTVKCKLTECLKLVHQMEVSEWFLSQRRELFLEHLSSQSFTEKDTIMINLSTKTPFDLIVKHKHLNWNWNIIQTRPGASKIIKQIDREWDWGFHAPRRIGNLEELVENFHDFIEDDAWSRISGCISAKFVASHLGDNYKWDLHGMRYFEDIEPHEYVALSRRGMMFNSWSITKVTSKASIQLIMDNLDVPWDWKKLYFGNPSFIKDLSDDERCKVLSVIPNKPKMWPHITFLTHFEFILAHPEFPWCLKHCKLTEEEVEKILGVGIPIDLEQCVTMYSHKLILKYPHLKWNGYTVSQKYCRSLEEITELMEADIHLDYEGLSSHLDLELVFRFPDKPWNGGSISQRVKTICDIKNNPRVKWDWKVLSTNKSIIPSFVRHPGEPWDFTSKSLLDHIVEYNMVETLVGYHITKKIDWVYLSSICDEKDLMLCPNAPWVKETLFQNKKISDEYIWETKFGKWEFGKISKMLPSCLIERKQVLFHIPGYAWNFSGMSRCNNISQNLDIIAYFINRDWNWEALSYRVPLWFALEHKDKSWIWTAFQNIPIEQYLEVPSTKMSLGLAITNLF